MCKQFDAVLYASKYQAADFHLSGHLMDEEGTNYDTLLCLLGSFKGLARFFWFEVLSSLGNCVC